jgi:hypothetical protein
MATSETNVPPTGCIKKTNTRCLNARVITDLFLKVFMKGFPG